MTIYSGSHDDPINRWLPSAHDNNLPFIGYYLTWNTAEADSGTALFRSDFTGLATIMKHLSTQLNRILFIIYGNYQPLPTANHASAVAVSVKDGIRTATYRTTNPGMHTLQTEYEFRQFIPAISKNMVALNLQIK